MEGSIEIGDDLVPYEFAFSDLVEILFDVRCKAVVELILLVTTDTFLDNLGIKVVANFSA